MNKKNSIESYCEEKKYIENRKRIKIRVRVKTSRDTFGLSESAAYKKAVDDFWESFKKAAAKRFSQRGMQ